MRYTSGPGFDSQWRPNIFSSVLFKKACERERKHLTKSIFKMVKYFTGFRITYLIPGFHIDYGSPGISDFLPYIHSPPPPPPPPPRCSYQAPPALSPPPPTLNLVSYLNFFTPTEVFRNSNDQYKKNQHFSSSSPSIAIRIRT